LQGADLSGANLWGAKGLTQAELATACGDQDTVLPDGFSITPCKQIEKQQQSAE
jgi:uncharacterized protein YjbI with pentapeptide repeats